jgi:hypothetical protein
VAYEGQRYSRGPRPCICRELHEKLKVKYIGCVTELRPVQAWALFEMSQAGGLLGSIGVGHGKTLLDILAPLALGLRLGLLLVPANTRNQILTEYELYREHWHVPSIVIHGKGYSENAPTPTGSILHVMSYDSLSRANATDFINQLNPDGLIFDEFQRIRDLKSVRTDRVLRRFIQVPASRCAAWTGSPTDKGVCDYSHISAFALKYGSPLPLKPNIAEEWGGAIDPVKRNEEPAAPGALMKLCGRGESIRAGYKRRLTETLGVVTTESSATNAKLKFIERSPGPLPAELTEHLAKLRNEWVYPDGDIINEAFDRYRCGLELAAGFWYKRIFPRNEPLDLREEWFEKRTEWNSAVRSQLKDREPFMDSPALCQQAAMRAWGDIPRDGGPEWRHPAWPAWRDIADQVKPAQETVRVNDYLARDAATWAHEHRGIVWYQSTAFGLWVAELGQLPLHAGGPKAAERIAQEQGDRSIVASIGSHGTGRNGLQKLFCEQYITQPPSTGDEWEQLLGRLARLGQQAKIITTWVCRHTPEIATSVEQAVSRARYAEETFGSRQKMLTGWA